MLRIVSTTTLIGVVLLLTSGCEHKCPTNETKDAAPPAADAHDHGEAGHDDHAGHDHAHDVKSDDHTDADTHDHGEVDHDDHADHDHTGDMTGDDHADDDAHDHGEADHDDHAHDVKNGDQVAEDTHDHGEAGHDDHADHDHAGDVKGDGHDHGGQRHELGSQEIGGVTVEVVQFGTVTGNVAELVFEIDAQGEPAPTAIRLLVRAPDGAESLKVKADKTGDHEYHAHLGELPDELGEGSVVVIEVETPAGTEELVFPLKR